MDQMFCFVCPRILKFFYFTALSLSLSAFADGEVRALTPAEEAEEKVYVLTDMIVVDERDLFARPNLPSIGLDVAMSVYDFDFIERQTPHNLTEALNYLPGVLTETRGRKVKQFSSFRGQVYPYPDYAINGIWQREFEEMPYTFPAEFIETFEVMRSSGSLLMGLTDASGLINVRIKRFTEPTTILKAEYGSFDTINASAATGDGSEEGYYTLMFNQYSTEGADGMNAAERYTSGAATFGRQVNEQLEMEGYFYILNGSRELRSPDPDILDIFSPKRARQLEEYDPINTVSAGLIARYDRGDDSTTEVSIYGTHRDACYKVVSTKASENGESKERDFEYGINAHHALRLSPENILRVGGTYNHWESPTGKRLYAGRPQDIHSFSGVLVDEHDFGRWKVDAGVRYTRDYIVESTNSFFDINGTARHQEPVRNQWDEPVISAMAGVVVEISPVLDLNTHVSFGTLSAPTGAVDRNLESTIENETRLMLDAGFKYHNSRHGMAKICLFYTVRDNVSFFEGTYDQDPMGNPVDEFEYFSNRDIKQYGIEFEVVSRKFYEDSLSFFANGTFMETTNRQPDGSDGEEKEIPDVILAAGASWERGPFNLDLFGKYVGAFENNRFLKDKTMYADLGDYVDLNVTASYSYGRERQTRFYLTIKNLLDDEFSTVPGYSDDGFRVFTGVRYRY